MVDTVRPITDLVVIFADGQAPGSITPQDMRDFVVSAMTPRPSVVTNYTTSGAISLTDDLSVVNSSASVAMTLTTPPGFKVIRIKRYGTGSVTVTATIDGVSSQQVIMDSVGGKEMLKLEWSTALSTWLMG